MSILNTAGVGKFSSDRTLAENAKDICGFEAVTVELQGTIKLLTTKPLNYRSSGILLLHPTSLTGGHCIGNLGTAVYQFVDSLDCCLFLNS